MGCVVNKCTNCFDMNHTRGPGVRGKRAFVKFRPHRKTVSNIITVWKLTEWYWSLAAKGTEGKTG